MYWYSNMKSRVRWEQEFSDYFDVLSGVKQGGVLSPRIFTFYVDGLIKKLRHDRKGCYLFSYFVASIMYADDLCLLAPSRGAMQRLLSICEEFCQEFCLTFNARKSKSLIFGKCDIHTISPLKLNGVDIEFVPSWKYLGCTVVSGPALSFSTSNELGAFYASSNSILRSIKKPNEIVLMKLLYNNCVPNLNYCAEVKKLSARDMNKCNVALNDCIRKISTYNRWESTCSLRQELRYPNVYEIFAARKSKFLRNNARSSNDVIRKIADELLLVS